MWGPEPPLRSRITLLLFLLTGSLLVLLEVQASLLIETHGSDWWGFYFRLACLPIDGVFQEYKKRLPKTKQKCDF